MASKKNIPEINASSQADIAFTVLIFFLVVSTMDIDTGIVRVLPPMADPKVKQEDIKVKERNLLLVFVAGSGNIMATYARYLCRYPLWKPQGRRSAR